VKAGRRDRGGPFPPNSAHGKVEARLGQIAELLDKAGKPPAENKNGEKTTATNSARLDPPKRKPSRRGAKK